LVAATTAPKCEKADAGYGERNSKMAHVFLPFTPHSPPGQRHDALNSAAIRDSREISLTPFKAINGNKLTQLPLRPVTSNNTETFAMTIGGGRARFRPDRSSSWLAEDDFVRQDRLWA
jgi:hypothetical protein